MISEYDLGHLSLKKIMYLRLKLIDKKIGILVKLS